MDRRFSCPDLVNDPNEGPADIGANHIPGTPTTPSAGSWMLACSNNTNRPFTLQDITALTTVYLSREQPANTIPVYRYYNSSNETHFYTANYNELGSGRNGYVIESIEFFIHPTQVSGSAPVYRYFNGSKYLYTTNWAELGSGRNGWIRENDLGYAFGFQADGTFPIFRYLHSNGNHFYTTIQRTYPNYISEGIAFYAYP